MLETTLRKVFVFLLVLAVSTAPALAQQPPAREITRIAGDLYRFRNGGHYSVFLVTRTGIIATDPINAEAARWLKQALSERFAQTVKYLIFSHDHADHISGGEVFADTATVIAHERAKATILGEARPTAVPEIVFSDRMTVELGGKRVELIYLGKNHSDNSIVMRFPEERVLFAVDFIPIESLPFRDLSDAYIEDWIESLRRAEALDFDVLAPGHGSLGRKEHVGLMRDYLDELRTQVLQQLRQGKSVDEIKELVKMEKYSHWGNYERYLPLNIEGMVRHIQLHRRGN